MKSSTDITIPYLWRGTSIRTHRWDFVKVRFIPDSGNEGLPKETDLSVEEYDAQWKK